MDRNDDAANDAFIGIDIDIEPFETKKDKADRARHEAAAARSARAAAASKAKKSKAAASRKRPRPKSAAAATPATPSTAAAAAAASRKKRPKKPKPPPNPPSSLVSLLRKDATVRGYFMSLQENLDYDVDKWKHEAGKWKRMAGNNNNNAAAAAAAPSSSAPASFSKSRKNGANGNGNNNGAASDKKERAKQSSNKSGSSTPSKPFGQKTHDKEAAAAAVVPITEDVWDDILNGDDDSSCSSTKTKVMPDYEERAAEPNDNDEPPRSPRAMREIRNGSGTATGETTKAQNERHSRILERLREAKECLDVLGVSLVEVEVISTAVTKNKPTMEKEDAESRRKRPADSIGAFDDETPAVDNNGNEDNNATTASPENNASSTTMIERILRRRSDEDVVAGMMASFRNLIKCSLLIGSDLLNNNPNATAAAGPMNKNTNKYDDENSDDDGIDEDEKLMKEVTGENNPRLNNDELMHLCELRRSYHPFRRDGELHVPAVYYSNDDDESSGDGDSKGEIAPSKEGEGECASAAAHPASAALKRLLRVLSVMDACCGDDAEDDDWNAVFSCDGKNYHDGNLIGDGGEDGVVDGVPLLLYDADEEDAAILRIGMRNRRRLAERLLSSLDVEIARAWASAERASNLATPTTHFHVADVLDADDPANEDARNKPYGAKSYNRLANLAERVGHARIASVLHRRRGDLQKSAELVVGYVVSSAPSLGAERYPKLAPALSICILEALLAPERYVPTGAEGSELDDGQTDGSNVSGAASEWFEKELSRMFATSSHHGDGNSEDESSLLLLRAIAHPVHIAASIWRERSICADDRIRDVAMVELAAYKRIQRLGTWLNGPSFAMLDAEHISKLGGEILSLAVSPAFHGKAATKYSNKLRAVSGICCTISLLTLGDNDRIIQLCDKMILGMKDPKSEEGAGSIKDTNLFLLPACCSAYSSIRFQKWENMKLGNVSGRHTAGAFTVEDKFSPILDLVAQHIGAEDWTNIDVLLQCCVLLGDGRNLQRLADRVLPNLTRMILSKGNNGGTTATTTTTQRKLMSRMMTAFIDAGELPTVRVINLERRPDRSLDFISCAAQKEQLLVIKGPVKMRRKALIAARKNPKTAFIDADEGGDGAGDFAFDGQCSREELENQLHERLIGRGSLSDFVKAKWRPSELKAFDRDARDGFELVHTSMTEKACALSHIASWMGVESTLSEMSSDNRGQYGNVWYQKKLTRMFKISGFARGAALLHSNEDMDPVPVCVILEDDAVLSDRFAERLASLLEELPRDFHICSLGYSRPRAAPMGEYSTNLGIPSCLWYLTGYILSLEGSRHLIKSLPVTGPVDSWIGLKMCGNWDNRFGEMVGVGKYTNARTKLPSRKDLAKIMNFRAFAALVPLCAQKVGMSTVAAVTRRGWRDRDTDITYSG